MRQSLEDGYTQATDLAEFIVQTCDVDYRSAYVVVGKSVREASRLGIPGREITGRMLDDIAFAETGQQWGLAERDLTAVLDPMSIVRTRDALGGAAPSAVGSMVGRCAEQAQRLSERAVAQRDGLDRSTDALLAKARQTVAETKEAP
jgi:argininosuccinate lyase